MKTEEAEKKIKFFITEIKQNPKLKKSKTSHGERVLWEYAHSENSY